MSTMWQNTFRERMRRFEAGRSPQPNELSVSIKVRVTSGCFHREHSPHAYTLIDRQLARLSARANEFAFEEHESGPEILAYLAVATAGATLAKSVIDLITSIIKARSAGVRRGDRPSDPIELVVRRIAHGSEFREEVVLRVGHNETVGATTIKERLDEALRKLARQDADRDEPEDSSQRS